MQGQIFLSSIYQIAPHLQPQQALLLQRLSETLQNRRKYLLDKRLGKRGCFGSSQSHQPEGQRSRNFATGTSELLNFARTLEAVQLQGDTFAVKQEPM